VTLNIGDIFRLFTHLFSSSADQGGPARRAPGAFEQDPRDVTLARHASGPPEVGVEVRSRRLYSGRRSLGDGARSIQRGQSVADRLWVAQWEYQQVSARLPFLPFQEGLLTGWPFHKSGSSRLVEAALS